MYSKTLLVCLVVHFLSDYSRGQRDEKFFRKDYTYREAVGSFYKIHSKNRVWLEAQRVCALEGANLFYPENADEAQVVLSLWNETKSSVNFDYMYVGLSNLLATELFETIDGKQISEVYNNWGPGQPDSNSNSDCVIMDKQGHLNDIRCHNSFSFICKKSLESVEWNDSCNMSITDYTYNQDLGKCYKLHTTPSDWNNAYLMCRAELSYLAVTDTKREAEYFVNLTESAHNFRLQENYQRGIYHLGFHKKLQQGWRTVTGNRLNADINWFGDNRLDAGDERQCGSMFYTGLLNNIDCTTTKSFFICEHDINSYYN